MADQPNILFVFPDQLRADCVVSHSDGGGLSAFVETPNLDYIADTGVQFTRAYTPAPTCVPARRCLWSGQTPVTSESTGWVTDPWDFEHTLPGELSRAGYHTRLIGKTHSFPDRNHFGFDEMELHTGLSSWDRPGKEDEYAAWLAEQVDSADEVSHGLSRNTVDGRPWHLEERLHPTNWTTTRAVRFLESRDETRPFFLTLGYMRPHNPFDPPEPYFDMYANRDIPDPAIGDWVDDVYGDVRPSYLEAKRGSTPNPWCADLSSSRLDRTRAAYFGLITQLDHQLRRVTKTLELTGELSNTAIVVAADHGDMLGDHHLWFKSYGYEGSARIPLLVRLPDTVDAPRGLTVNEPVGLEDLMPTLLDLANVPVPDTVEGHSLRPLLDGTGSESWREYYHGEHAPVYHSDNAMQYLVDEQSKYIWNPVTGDELLFDLESDPRETHDLAGEPDHQSELETWRERLVDRLASRPEAFTDGEQLRAGAVEF
ncbi:arylsulfatase [Halovenus marina]|uniref:arylsulfatase n=1 Tax=Halovenus marina TaxID=3396621 RepID=UPI003F57F2BC